MHVLGIETSGEVTGVAVVGESGVLAEISFRHAMQLSSSLAPRMRDVLHLAGVKARDLGGVAVSRGPGSFTGLRIGVAAAKGLAFAAGIPITSICTLEAVAFEFPQSEGTQVWAVVAASRSDVFAAPFLWRAAGLQSLAEPAVVPLQQLLENLEQQPEALLVAGALGGFQEVLAAAAGTRLLSSAHGANPRPATIAALGRARLLRGEGTPVHEVAPRYLLLSAAEARRVAGGVLP